MRETFDYARYQHVRDIPTSEGVGMHVNGGAFGPPETEWPEIHRYGPRVGVYKDRFAGGRFGVEPTVPGYPVVNFGWNP